jgi:dTDP-4-dehydrorhamnose 3,5-epimerase
VSSELRSTSLPEVSVERLPVFTDARGATCELWSVGRVHARQGVLDLVSTSKRGVVRGLHYQHPSSQWKVVTVLAGTIFDVVVDIRMGSPRFGRLVTLELSSDIPESLFIPQGFAHGFCVTSERAVVLYRLGAPYAPGGEGGVSFRDPDLSIPWPCESPIVSPKDAALPPLSEIPRDRLPAFEG